LLTEKVSLLNTIQEKEKTIQQLETKLKEVSDASKEIIKEIPVNNLAAIQKLQTELSREKLKTTQLTYYCWIISAICILFLVVARVKKGKTRQRFDIL